ncbi:hypothetical protein EO92_01525 [Methanosarcina sp. 2.H.A.1B.4]|nr:hypothetical protein EO92_01525 [Methanosarcina sp. 2.H.A.1B.4]
MYCELKSGFRGKGKYSLRPWDFFNIMPFLIAAPVFRLFFLTWQAGPGLVQRRKRILKNSLPDSGIDQPINQGPPYFLISIF